MKQVLAAVGGLLIIIGGLVTGQAYGWFGQATHNALQAIGGPIMAGLGIALLWVNVTGRTS